MSKPTNGTTANGTAKNNLSVVGTETTSTPELSTTTVDKTTGELKQEEPAEAAKLMPPIEARLKRLEELMELQEKRETIVTALENLNKFYVSPSGGCNLKLTDSKGISFGIAHPIVIGEMVHMAKAKLQDELTKIENQFVFTV